MRSSHFTGIQTGKFPEAFADFSAAELLLRHQATPLFRAVPIEEARILLKTVLDPELEKGSVAYSELIGVLAELNSTSPGILTWAIAPNEFQVESLGAPFNQAASAWKSAIPHDAKLNGKVTYVNTERDWLESKSPEVRIRVQAVTERFLSANQNIKNASKPHLASVEVSEDGTLILNFDKADYGQNAAISKALCNSLRDLLHHGEEKRVPGERRETDIHNIEKVIDLLRDLGIYDVSRGVDFLDVDSPFPQTLGVSVMAVTSDGYLITSVQGRNNSTSVGHTIPLASGSFDVVPSGTFQLDSIPDALRELAEEQEGLAPVCETKFLGLVRGADQGGKPELFTLVTLNLTLAEFQQRADLDESKGKLKLSELAKKLGQPFLVGNTLAKILERGAEDQLGPAIPARGGKAADQFLADLAFNPNCNQILATGMLSMLQSRSTK